MFDPDIWWLAPLVFAATFMDAIAGGGGLILVPAFMLTGLAPVAVLGAAKLVSTAGTFFSAGHFLRHGHVQWPAVLLGIPFALGGSMLGARSIVYIDPAVARLVLLVGIPVAAGLVLLPKPKQPATTQLTWVSPALWWSVPLIAGALGWYDGFFGPGCGTLLMLALHGVTRLNLLQSAGIARTLNLLSNIGGLATFAWHGTVPYRLAVPLALVSVVGHTCGARVAIRRGIGVIRLMLVVASTLLLVTVAWQQFRR